MTNTSRDDGREALSPAFVVILRFTNLALFSFTGHEPRDVGLPELMLLERLEASGRSSVDDVVRDVATRTGVDLDRLMQFASDLRERHLLCHETDLESQQSHAQRVQQGPGSTAQIDVEAELVAMTPLVFRLTRRGYELLDHDGLVILTLDAADLAAMTEFRTVSTPLAAMHRHRTTAGAQALPEARFTDLMSELTAAGLLVRFDEHDLGGRENRDARKMYAFYMRFSHAVDAACATHGAAEQERERSGHTSRVPIIPIDDRGNPTPLALGMILANALAYKDGMLNEHYQLVPEWLTREARLERVAPPGMYLFSNYIWSHGHNLSYSELVKRNSPFSLTIHGGPDTPKYEGDVETYFRANPHVDIAVHGEGEETTAALLEALIGSVGDGPPDLTALRDVPGLSFRDGDQVITTAKRDRVADLDAIPSPFLTGLFDVHAAAGASMAILETNRGCPYGCTFCDWGSATLSRIRKFDLGRVFDELEWCAQHGIARVFLADANFGIMERDVEIAGKVAELKATYGYPALFSTNYAKNTTKHLKDIVGTLTDAGILIQGLLSLQSMDDGVLKTVKRSNIKTEKYDELAHQFRSANLPLFVDLMLGLPGATTKSFRGDLQNCINREVTAKIYPTELLVNSPMNELGYRTEHRIETSAPLGSLVKTSRNTDGSTKRALVVATSSFSRADYDEMLELRRVFIVADNFGVLRQVSRFVRQELGIAEIDLYDRLRIDSRERPDRWPALSFTFRVVPFLGTPPVSWHLLIEEVRTYLTNVLGLPASPAFDTVLRVQHTLLPARGREFPVSLDLPHDFTAWNRAMVDVKDAGHFDWERRVPHLGEFPPGVFVVDDPHDVCGRALGQEIDDNAHASWELESPVARAVSHEHMWDAESA